MYTAKNTLNGFNILIVRHETCSWTPLLIRMILFRSFFLYIYFIMKIAIKDQCPVYVNTKINYFYFIRVAKALIWRPNVIFGMQNCHV